MKTATILPGPISLLLGTALLAGFTGCESEAASRRRLTAKLATATKEMADVLAEIKDKPTATAARPKIQKLIEQVEDWTEQIDAQETSVGIGDEVTLESHGRWIGEHTRMMKEQYRIGQIPAAREGLGDTWKKLTGGAYDPGGVFGPGGKMDMGAMANPAIPPDAQPGNAPPTIPRR
jgi:predicted DNA-binding protein